MRVTIRRGIQVAKNCKAVGTKYSRNNRENFGVSCNNKINEDDCMNGKCVWLSIEVYRWKGIAKAMAQSIEGTSETNFGIF